MLTKQIWPGCCCSCLLVKNAFGNEFCLQKYFTEKMEVIWTISFEIEQKSW